MLVFRNGVFFQWIEGSPAEAHKLMASLHGNARHHDVVSLDIGAEERERLYPAWDMVPGEADDICAVLHDALETTEDENNIADLDRILARLGSAPLASLGGNWPYPQAAVLLHCDLGAAAWQTRWMSRPGDSKTWLLQFFAASLQPPRLAYFAPEGPKDAAQNPAAADSPANGNAPDCTDLDRQVLEARTGGPDDLLTVGRQSGAHAN